MPRLRLAVFVTLIALIAAACGGGGAETTTTTTSTTSTTTTTVPAPEESTTTTELVEAVGEDGDEEDDVRWITFTSGTYPMEVSFPENWTFDAEPADTWIADIYPPGYDATNSPVMIDIQAQEFPDDATLDEYVDAVYSFYISSYPDLDLTEDSALLWDGVDAWRLIMYVPDGDFWVHQTMAVYEGFVYTYKYHGIDPEYTDHIFTAGMIFGYWEWY